MNFEREYFQGHYPEMALPLSEAPQRLNRETPGGTLRPALGKTLDELVGGFSEQVAVVDEDWTILAVNDPWKHMVRVGGYDELRPGTNYRHFLETFAGRGRANARLVLNAIDAISTGESNSFEFTYAGVDQWEGRTLQVRINRLHIGGRSLATIARNDITASKELAQLREMFSSSVMESQAEERKRFGRELHDSTAQLLSSVGLLLATLKRQAPSDRASGVVDELQQLVREMHQEIRSISYLAHPPALDKMSLSNALRALVEGFARRTGLDMSFEVRGKRFRLSPATENALYRIAQEALSNVHRHAHATRIRVLLCFRRSTCHLAVTDNGIGIPRGPLAGKGKAGVGLLGMLSRMSEIGGRVSVRRLCPGTLIIATVRAAKRSAAGAA